MENVKTNADTIPHVPVQKGNVQQDPGVTGTRNPTQFPDQGQAQPQKEDANKGARSR